MFVLFLKNIKNFARNQQVMKKSFRKAEEAKTKTDVKTNSEASNNQEIKVKAWLLLR